MKKVKTVRIKPYFRKNGIRVKGHTRNITLNHNVNRVFDPSLRLKPVIRKISDLPADTLNRPNIKKINNDEIEAHPYGSYTHKTDTGEGLIQIDPALFFDKEGNFKNNKAEKEFMNVMLHEELHHFDTHFRENPKHKDAINMNHEKGIYFAAEHASGYKPWNPKPELKKELYQKKLKQKQILRNAVSISNIKNKKKYNNIKKSEKYKKLFKK